MKKLLTLILLVSAGISLQARLGRTAAGVGVARRGAPVAGVAMVTGGRRRARRTDRRISDFEAGYEAGDSTWF